MHPHPVLHRVAAGDVVLHHDEQAQLGESCRGGVDLVGGLDLTYRDLAASAVRPGGFLIVATFALDGPTHCFGPPLARYGPAELARVTKQTATSTVDQLERAGHVRCAPDSATRARLVILPTAGSERSWWPAAEITVQEEWTRHLG